MHDAERYEYLIVQLKNVQLREWHLSRSRSDQHGYAKPLKVGTGQNVKTPFPAFTNWLCSCHSDVKTNVAEDSARVIPTSSGIRMLINGGDSLLSRKDSFYLVCSNMIPQFSFDILHSATRLL